jgi:TetR/AcrR family transcriptional repressor of nem operon
MPILASDVPRLSEPCRRAYADGVRSLTTLLEGWLSTLDFLDPGPLAMSVMNELVGSISLARAEPDAAHSDAILEASYQQLHLRLGLA